MRWNLGQNPFVLAALACIALASGCVDEDILASGYFDVQFVPSVEAGGPGFECVIMDISALVVRAADGQCSPESGNAGDVCGNDDDCTGGTCLGALAQENFATGITVLPSALPLVDPEHPEAIAITQANNVSFTGDRCRSPQSGPSDSIPLADQPQFKIPSVILSSGTYFIDSLNAAQEILLVDDTTSTFEFCSGFNLADAFPEPIIFTVGKDQPNVVRILVDTAVLAGLLPGNCSASAPAFLTIP